MEALYDPLMHLRAALGDRWMFRWRLEYVNGTSKVGIWNGASRFEDTAAAQTKTGLLTAMIEGKHFLYRDQQRIFAECPGQDFVNFEHLACYVSNNKQPFTFVYGMRIRSRNNIVTAYANGSTERNDWRPDSDYRWPEWTKS